MSGPQSRRNCLSAHASRWHSNSFPRLLMLCNMDINKRLDCSICLVGHMFITNPRMQAIQSLLTHSHLSSVEKSSFIVFVCFFFLAAFLSISDLEARKRSLKRPSHASIQLFGHSTWSSSRNLIQSKSIMGSYPSIERNVRNDCFSV